MPTSLGAVQFLGDTCTPPTATKRTSQDHLHHPGGRVRHSYDGNGSRAGILSALMANRARILDVSEEDRQVLASRVQARTVSVRDLERARIVLLAAGGLPAAEIASRVGCSRPRVTLWRRRYEAQGLAGLGDEPRSGAPPRLTQARKGEILAATLAPPPESLGVTHWSSRLLARHLGDVSHVT
jgi:transposase-like protein